MKKMLYIMWVLAWSAAVQAAPGWIVVQSEPDSKNQIARVAMRDDGKMRHALPSIAGSGFGPLASPDGRKWLQVSQLESVSVQGIRNELRVGERGEKTGKVISSGLNIDEFGWTPDDKIWVTSGEVEWSRGRVSMQLSIIDPETGVLIRDFQSQRKRGAIPESLSKEGSPVWSPDGSWLLYTVSPGIIGGDAAGFQSNWETMLILVDLKDREKYRTDTRVIASMRGISDVSWSRDSTQFAFSGTWSQVRMGHINSNIYRANTNGEVTQLTFSRDTNFAPTWSPDSKRLAWFSNRRLTKTEKKLLSRIFLMNADGLSQRLLAPLSGRELKWNAQLPR